MSLSKEQREIVKTNARFGNLPVSFGLGLIDKETGGRVLYPVNGEQVPAIRIEGHYFYKLLSGDKRKEAVAAGLAASKAGIIKNPKTMTARYAMLRRMVAIDKTAAYQSISIGAGQIMGTHAEKLGYDSAEDMWVDAKDFEGQVTQLFEFINSDPVLSKAAVGRDYKTFALRYNGPKAPKSYWEDLQRFDEAYMSGAASEHPVDTDWLARIKSLGFGSVMEFQQSRSVKVDGIVGPITREEVAEAEAERKKAKQAPLEAAGKIGGAAIGVGTSAVAIDNPDAVNSIVQSAEPITTLVKTLAPLGTQALMVGAGLVLLYAGYKAVKYWLNNR